DLHDLFHPARGSCAGDDNAKRITVPEIEIIPVLLPGKKGILDEDVLRQVSTYIMITLCGSDCWSTRSQINHLRVVGDTATLHDFLEAGTRPFGATDVALGPRHAGHQRPEQPSPETGTLADGTDRLGLELLQIIHRKLARVLDGIAENLETETVILKL